MEMSSTAHGPSKAPAIYGVASSMMALAIAAICIRFWSRVRSKTFLWWDDWLALATLPFALSINILFIVTATVGVGRHISDIADPASSASLMIKLNVAIQFIMCIGTTLIKLSALAFYARIFKGTSRLRIALWVAAAASISYSVVVAITYYFRCGTVKKGTGDDAICLSASSAEIYNCTIDVMADLVILVLPLPALAKLNLPFRRRLELCVVFALGCGFTLITLLREIFAIQVFKDMAQFEKDPFWLVVPFNIAAVCEQPVGLLTISLPAAYPVLKEVGRRMRDAMHAVEQAVPTLTGYSNGPRLRSALPMPSLGSRFEVRSEHIRQSSVVYYGSESDASTLQGKEERSLKMPEKAHTVTEEVV